MYAAAAAVGWYLAVTAVTAGLFERYKVRLRGHTMKIIGGLAAAAGVFTLTALAGCGTSAPAAAPTVTDTVAGPVVTRTVTVAPTATVTVKPTPRHPAATIPGDGTYRVGREVRPGTYKAAPAPDGDGDCYWARLSSADEDAVISNHIGGGPTFVTIHATDRYFQTAGCTTWRRV